MLRPIASIQVVVTVIDGVAVALRFPAKVKLTVVGLAEMVINSSNGTFRVMLIALESVVRRPAPESEKAELDKQRKHKNSEHELAPGSPRHEERDESAGRELQKHSDENRRRKKKGLRESASVKRKEQQF